MTQAAIRTPANGEQAPLFRLQDTHSQQVSLEDLRGKTVVLLFFPAAFTHVCTAELCTFRDNATQLAASDAVVLGISVDGPWTLRRFATSQGIDYPLLSDFDRAATTAYGIPFFGFYGFTSPVSKRAVFVIDPQGRIAWQWIGQDLNTEPPYSEILQAIANC